MRYRDPSEPLVARVGEDLKGALAQLLRRRSRERAMELIERGQQPDVGLRVAAGEGAHGSLVATHPGVAPVLAHQTCDLGAGQTAHTLDEAQYQSPLGPG